MRHSPGAMSRCFHPLLLAAGLLAGGIGLAAPTPASGWWDRLGVRDLDGAPLAVPGRFIVIVFISPECPVANAEIPVLNALAARFGPAGAGFVGVYADPTLATAALRRHAADYHLGFATADDRAQKLLRTLGATYTPETFVFSADGTLLYRGRIDDRVEDFGPARVVAAHEDLRDVLAALTAGRPAPFARRPGFGCSIPAPLPR